MTEITLPSGKYALVTVPADTSGHKVDNTKGYGAQLSFNLDAYTIHDCTQKGCIYLLTGNYTILGLASAITEDVAVGIVDYYYENFYADYMNPGDTELFYVQATNSLHSLVRSHGMEPENTLIIKIEE